MAKTEWNESTKGLQDQGDSFTENQTRNQTEHPLDHGEVAFDRSEFDLQVFACYHVGVVVGAA